MTKTLILMLIFLLFLSCGTDGKAEENDVDVSLDDSVVNDENEASDENVFDNSDNESDEDIDEAEDCENYYQCLEKNCSGTTGSDRYRCMNRFCHCEEFFCFGETACLYNGMPDPYGFIDIDADFNYAYINEEPLTNDEYIKNSPFVVGTVSNDLIDDFRYATGIESYLYSYDESYLALTQKTIFDDSLVSLDLEDAIMDVELYFMKGVAPGVKSVDYYSTDGVLLLIYGEDRCVHAVGKGEITILDGQYGEHENGSIKVQGTDIEIYSPHYTPVFEADVKADLEGMGFEICDFLDSCWRHYQCGRP